MLFKDLRENVGRTGFQNKGSLVQYAQTHQGRKRGSMEQMDGLRKTGIKAMGRQPHQTNKTTTFTIGRLIRIIRKVVQIGGKVGLRNREKWATSRTVTL
jgi:hypothetical protein